MQQLQYSVDTYLGNLAVYGNIEDLQEILSLGVTSLPPEHSYVCPKTIK